VELNGWGRRLALTAATTLLACASPGRRLAASRDFTEALCASAFHSREPQAELSYVRRRIDAEARPRLHLHALSRDELTAALGPAGDRLADHAVVVRAIASLDDVDISDVQLRVVLVGHGDAVPPRPLTRQTVSDLTGEMPPQAREVHTAGGRHIDIERFHQRPLLGLTAVALEASTMFIIPVTEFTRHTRRTTGSTVTVEPTQAEIAAAAPATAALLESAEHYTSGGEGMRDETSRVWLWPTLDDPDATIVVEWTYLARGCVDRRPRMREPTTHSVEVTEQATLRLPAGPDLASRINARFGDRMQLLASEDRR
jgi:hypothetical protein